MASKLNCRLDAVWAAKIVPLQHTESCSTEASDEEEEAPMQGFGSSSSEEYQGSAISGSTDSLKFTAASWRNSCLNQTAVNSASAISLHFPDSEDDDDESKVESLLDSSIDPSTWHKLKLLRPAPQSNSAKPSNPADSADDDENDVHRLANKSVNLASWRRMHFLPENTTDPATWFRMHTMPGMPEASS
mmetsp:Transcript_539/g.936  ORF Transcript_539/g.936 Transcript_539/m.936 type:complete len:189 (-) Transcript_539:11-577(-)